MTHTAAYNTLPPLTPRLITTCRAQNPALRHELSFEMGQVHSEDMALHFGNPGQGGPAKYIKPVLSREDQKYSFKAGPQR